MSEHDEMIERELMRGRFFSKLLKIPLAEGIMVGRGLPVWWNKKRPSWRVV